VSNPSTVLFSRWRLSLEERGLDECINEAQMERSLEIVAELLSVIDSMFGHKTWVRVPELGR
jgi:hypothetical protein